jgi:hypothetical protein
VVSDPPGQGAQTTRRALLAGGVASGTIALAGCGSSSLRSKVKKGAKVAPADIDVLDRLLDLERYTIAAYAAGIPLLGGSASKAAKQFLGQELAHAGTLAGLIKQAGGKASEPRASYALGHPRGAADVLALLHRLEADQLAAYLQMLPALSSGRLRSTAAAIMANDAQHLSVLRQALGQPPVPAARATGRE